MIKIILKQTKIKYFLMLVVLLFAGEITAQNLTLKVENKPLREVLTLITQSSGYTFVYSNALKEIDSKVSISCENLDIVSVLNLLLKDKGISYKIEDKNIALTPDSLTKAIKQGKTDLRKVSGVIEDENGETLPGVTIENKSTRKYTSSDLDGNFQIEAKVGDKLAFSFIGMIDNSTLVSTASIYNVILKTDLMVLDDVIVTGYQTISKERSTGSFVKVSAEELASKPVSNLFQALIGLTPGMAVTRDENGNNRFLIRGQGSLQEGAGLDPLIVVDGFAIQGFSDNIDPFETINPNDVESVTVLKDAAATSIYGARAANGVIVITTKKGRAGNKMSINFDAFVSISNKPDLDYAFNLADTETTISYLENLEKYASSYNSSASDPYYDASKPFVFIPKASELLFEYKRKGSISQAEYEQGLNQLRANDGKWMDDYNKYLYRNKITQQYNLNINGASEKNRYSFSMIYDNELGTSRGDLKERVLMNISNTYEIMKNLTVSIGANAHFGKNKHNGISFNEIKQNTSPYTRLVDDNGDFISMPWTGSFGARLVDNKTGNLNSMPWTGSFGSTMYGPILRDKYGDKLPTSWEYNPVQDRDEIDFASSNFNFRAQASIDYKIIKGLSISLKGQYENNSYSSKDMYSEESYVIRNYVNTYSTLNPATGLYKSQFPNGGMYSTLGNKYTSYNLRGQIDFNRTFAGKHDLTALLGGELLSATTNNVPDYTVYGYNEHTNSVITKPDYINRVKNIFGNNVYFPFSGSGMLDSFEDRFLSAYMNASYTYDRRYSISASARVDASNFISDDVRKKFSPFWHVGVAWNIRNEKFMSEVSFIDFLKVRASFGTAGVAAGKNAVSTLTTLSSRPGDIVLSNNEPYNTISVRGNPLLTWEKSRTLNVGVDFSLWDSALYGSLEYYDRYSYDVLAEATVPYLSQSISRSTYNNAIISNKGVEISLGSVIPIADNISWNGDFNLAWNRNRVIDYNVVPVYAGGNYVEGRPLFPMYAYNIIGYTPEGLPKLEGKDGTVEIGTNWENIHTSDRLEPGQGPDDSNWKQFYGTAVPTVNLGFTNTFKIYNFTVSFMITGKFGHLYRRPDVLSSGHNAAGYSKYLVESMEMDKNKYVGEYGPMPIYNENNKDTYNSGYFYGYMAELHGESSAQLRDASHIRLNEVYLGYDLPEKIFKKSRLRGMRVFAQARNLGLIWAANGEGVDPDFIIGNLKPMATWTFGLKLKF